MSRNFRTLLKAQWSRGKFVCVGLDSAFEKIPKFLHQPGAGNPLNIAATVVEFNKAIVDATGDVVAAYKPNLAFYAQLGEAGVTALRQTIAYIHEVAPDVPVILDAKYADIGNTNVGYVRFAFDVLGADAVTVNPYLGREALKPFLDMRDKGIIVLCRTSNPGAGEFQNLVMQDGRPLFRHVAEQVVNTWNDNGNCMIVVGATAPAELELVRDEIGDMGILLPGIGAQGGVVENTVSVGVNSVGTGILVNSSRGIIFGSDGEDFAEVARARTIVLNDQILAAIPRDSSATVSASV